MKHLREEDLILHHYGEPDAAPWAEEHLTSCAACAEEYRRLSATLAVVSKAAPPDLPPFFESRVWSRVRERLEAPAARGPSRRWLWALATTMLVAIAFLVGRYGDRTEVASVAPFVEPSQERILLEAIAEQLERTTRILVEMANSEVGVELDVSDTREAASDLLTSSRILRLRARAAGESTAGVVLEEVERILLDLARGPSSLGPDEVVALRERIESQNLIFKMRVVERGIRARSLNSQDEILRRNL